MTELLKAYIIRKKREEINSREVNSFLFRLVLIPKNHLQNCPVRLSDYVYTYGHSVTVGLITFKRHNVELLKTSEWLELLFTITQF